MSHEGIGRTTDILAPMESDREAGPRDVPTAIDWDKEDARLRSVLFNTLTDGGVFVDIGANRGVFAIPVAEHLGSEGRVFAFEPASDAIQELRRRAGARHVLDRISLYQVALGSATDVGLLRADGEHPDDSTKRSLFIDGPVVQEVAVHTFDELVDSRAVPLDGRLDAVKIDVEGAELHVLRGMQVTIQACRPSVIIVETIDRHLERASSSKASLVQFLRDLRYAPIPSATPGVELNAVFVPD